MMRGQDSATGWSLFNRVRPEVVIVDIVLRGSLNREPLLSVISGKRAIVSPLRPQKCSLPSVRNGRWFLWHCRTVPPSRKLLCRLNERV